ncbi:MAG TPA: cytochrome c biogenesis protein CcsA [Candidatus Limnocylindrales bacterium]|nr:cytochrome c biogenesis protein CcsA [Candidatus Limnocylindrales bacterium]
MAAISQLLFAAGTVVLVVAFAAHIGHAVLLANGRRVAAAAAALASRTAASTSQPAWAGVATGSFVRERARAEAAGPAPFALGTSLSGIGQWLTVAAFAALAISLTLRGIVVGRGPWGNLFEFSVAFATSIVGGYLLLERRYPIRSIGAIPVAVAVFLVLYAASLPSEIEPLVPALQNAPLLTIHVGMAVLSYGIFATSFAAGIGYLVQGRTDRFGWLPSHKVLDEVAYRAVIIGFPIFATMIILGSWWASIAWSRYWGWDPKETAALVTWLVYAIYLHARNQRAWAGRPAALLLVVGFIMVLVTYSGSLWFSGLHAYSGL